MDCEGNLWVPETSNTETGFDYPFGTYSNYNTPPSFTNSDVVGTAADPGFSAESQTVFATNDYHVTENDPADGSQGNSVGTSGFPTAALTDREGNTRSTTVPNIGLYESFA